MPFVMDASVAVALVLGEDFKGYASAVLARASEEDVFVPSLWHIETRNALLMAVRRGRISPHALFEYVATLKELPVATQRDSDYDQVLNVALEQELSIYDATYLVLALTSGAALATLDQPLARAAKRAKIALI